jgi:major membrane immunogen (membrane-anchored lipoprotein)
MIAATTKAVVDHHNKTGEIKTEVPMFEKFFMVGNVNEAYLLDVLNDQTISNEELERFEKVNRKTRERTKFDNAMDNLLKANHNVVKGNFTA